MEIFEDRRGLLQAVAYRVLGTVTDAEDIVQEAWLRWSGVDAAAVEDPTAYLVKVTTRLAIDRLRSAQARRESYVGPWLPEPVLTGGDVADDVALADTVSSAMLLVLEALSPLERAVFVLREAFGYSHKEIGEILDRSEASVRQTMMRAREHVESRRRRYDTDPVTRRRAAESFLEASAGGDLAGLMGILAPDVKLVCDGGGLAPAPRRVLEGLELVAGALISFTGRMPEDPSVALAEVNGGPAIVVQSGGAAAVVVMLHLVDGMIEEIHLVSNPEKLGAV
ncbi:RNA polymerase sigma factor SigJ [Glycomyces algeriensis]|uniref:RNA polymerase sigma24 factor n=1 Tax=Glycomyces algeriensis TaxID=256037 RepID=A0A9W6GAQ0_9ACTN|nr:RNA polymerase sigma factor SigJ [Glycomyces algeriensis]MDA1368355.1 RNA polymerase sigma factor SigJ [Glycomyces algeriensis]MDR7351797.1 RNA polymerase sigma-70 factor (ECF subfamily) [Glycomyces algeriensis]GLI44524.1 RNA polymerase sigma24 factor [Glycomyces algeriensis]